MKKFFITYKSEHGYIDIYHVNALSKEAAKHIFNLMRKTENWITDAEILSIE